MWFWNDHCWHHSFITEPPTAEVQAPEGPFYLLGETTTMKCVTTDVKPTPYLYWRWQPCEHAGCVVNSERWTIVGNSRNIPEDIPSYEEGDLELLLTVRNEESGFYQCSASNSEGTVSDVHEFLVSGTLHWTLPGWISFQCCFCWWIHTLSNMAYFVVLYSGR